MPADFTQPEPANNFAHKSWRDLHLTFRGHPFHSDFLSARERLNREIRRRTRVVGSFPDGNSALMLVCARLRHVAGTQWGNKKYMNMRYLKAALKDTSIVG